MTGDTMPRFITSRTLIAGASTAEMLSPAQRRRRIILSPHAANRYSIAFGQDAVIDTGITIPAGASTPVVLTDEDLGDSINMQINVVAGAGATTIGYAEVNDT